MIRQHQHALHKRVLLAPGAVTSFYERKLDDWRWMKTVPRSELLSLLPKTFQFATEPRTHQLACTVLGAQMPRFLYSLEMGAGKSKIILDLIRLRKHEGNLCGALIAVPFLINLESWRNQLEQHAPDLTYTVLEGGKKERQELLLTSQTDVCLINYAGLPVYMAGAKRMTKKGTAHRALVLEDAEEFSNRFDFVALDECFPPDVEILTERGFIRFDALPKRLKCAQYEDGKITWVTPTSYTNRKHKGQLVQLQGPRLNLSMTPGHQILKCSNTGVWSKVSAEAVLEGKYGNCITSSSLTTAGLSLGKNNKLTDWERFMVAYQADGYLQSTQQDGSCTLNFHLTRQRKIDRLLHLLQKLGFRFKELQSASTQARNGKDRSFMIYGVRGASKMLIDTFPLADMGARRASLLIEEMVEWDGHKDSGTLWGYKSVVKENTDFYQAVAVLAGYRTNQTVTSYTNPKHRPSYNLSVSTRTNFISGQSLKLSKFWYEGRVYCVGVPSGNIVVRSNGKCLVVGNCHIGLGSVKSLQYQLTKMLSWRADCCYGATGTPMGRDPEKFWPQMHVIDRGETLGHSLAMFHAAYFKEKPNHWAYSGFDYVFDNKKKDHLHQTLQHRSLRYTDTEFSDMPAISYVQIPVNMTATQVRRNEEIVKLARDAVLAGEPPTAPFIRQRQTTAGFIAVRAEDDTRIEVAFLPNPKIDALEQFLGELDEEEKLVIFHSYVYSGALISALLTGLKIKHCGVGHGYKEPALQLRRFITDPKVRVFVANCGAGGTGVDGLQKVCRYVLFYESPTGPSQRKQAEKRLHRDGQKHRVHVYDLVARGISIDHRVLDSIAEGKDLFDAVVNGKEIVA